MMKWISVETFTKPVKVTKAWGTVEEPWQYVRLTIGEVTPRTATPELIEIEIDAGDFSKAMAKPGSKTLIELTTRVQPIKGSVA